MAMRDITLVCIFLAFACHGRRLAVRSEQERSYEEHQAEEPALKPLASLLLELDRPAAAWQAVGPSPRHARPGPNSPAFARPASSHVVDELRLASQPQMKIDMEKLKALRDQTSLGIGACKDALKEADWDLKKAGEILKAKGLLKAEKISGRKTAEGGVYSYVHHNKKVGVMMEVNCETDFVAGSPDFKQFVSNLCMMAAVTPDVTKVRVEDFTPTEIEAEKESARRSEDLEGKPADVKEKIVEGRVQKLLKNRALLEQDYGPDPSIGTCDEYVKMNAAKFGENIVIKRLIKFSLGETAPEFGEEEATEEAAKPAEEAPKPEAAKPAKAPKKKAAPVEAAAAPEPYELLDIRVGKIIEAWEHPNSTKLWVEKIEVGEEEPRQIASGLRAYYATKEELEGRKVLVVANLKTAKLAGVPSAGMVLCASNEEAGTVAFVEPPEDAEPGQRVLMDGKEPVDPATPNQMNKKKWMQKAADDLKTVDSVATYKGTPLVVAGGKCTSPTISEGTIS